jgi:hypothetical protein
MKKVLVIYFTQSGQLNEAVRATLSPLEKEGNVELHYEQVRPKTKFPFPWSYMEFFDAFPETVKGLPCELEPFSFDPQGQFDLVIIAYQPWFLSMSIPINSFLMSREAGVLLKDRNVVTVLACRNMWLNAQEKMKMALQKLGANLVGNVTFVDKSGNLTSLVTVLAFALGGVKEKFMGFFPKYGVSDKDLKELAPEFGKLVNKHLQAGDYTALQDELINAGAVNIKSNLMLLEGRGKVLFPLYAAYISRKGGSGSKKRRTRVRIFGIVLPIAILILSPIITIVSRLVPLIFSKKIKKEVYYYSHNTLRG